MRPTMHDLRAAGDALQSLLDVHAPGERLQALVTARPVTVPGHFLAGLAAAGPAIRAFHAAAQRIFREVGWVRALVEKRYHPNYPRLNDAHEDLLPLAPRPDVVPDEGWNPRIVEIDITVGGRAAHSLASHAYGLPDAATTLGLYVPLARRLTADGRSLALVSAAHPAFPTLAEARVLASMLAARGVPVEVVADEDLAYLAYRGGRLVCLRPGHRFEIGAIDRLIDILEIAEMTHPGMRPLLDAYLDGTIADVNTCKQFLDEKIWLALFFDPRLDEAWRGALDPHHRALLSRLFPFTAIVAPDTRVPVGEDWFPVAWLADLEASRRRFVTKESGTSDAAAGGRSVVLLHTMDGDAVADHLGRLARHGPPSVIQECIESARLDLDALDPATGGRVCLRQARVKTSPFYVDGRLGDVLLVASTCGYLVHQAAYIETVVDRPADRGTPSAPAGSAGSSRTGVRLA